MQRLDPHRYAPYLLTSTEGAFANRARAIGIQTVVHAFPWFSRRRPWPYARSLHRLVRTIRRKRIDLVHTNCDHSLPYVRQASRWARVPYVSHVRDFVRAWFDPQTVAVLNRAEYVLANSRAVANACRQAGVDVNRLRIVYNPVEVGPFGQVPRQDVCRFRQALSVRADALLIGMVGQFHPLKGQREFALAALRVASVLPKASFVVVGTAMSSGTVPYEKRVHDLVAASDVASRFHFTGFREDIAVVMNALDILVVPSHSESFGRVVVEGMASGCAVVASRSGGIPEIVEDGVDGLLVPAQDVEALVTALLALCADSHLRQRLSLAGQQKAWRFDVDGHVTQVQDLYDSVLWKG
jgi:glycosyltransferase involved in cell wall biosynthesis